MIDAEPHSATISIDHRDAPAEGGSPLGGQRRRFLRWIIVANVILAVWYFSWLLQPSQAGAPWLYGLLVAAELFNLLQAMGFWWTAGAERPIEPAPRWQGTAPRVDVLIPTYNEPLDIVEPTVAAAAHLGGPEVSIYLLDDGDRLEMRQLADRYNVRYVTRVDHRGAKAGNINHALGITDAPFVVVFDCDHVPTPEFLAETLGHFTDPQMAFVQTPQYYSNRDAGPIAAAAAAQQDLFFGIIARGKQAKGAMFCCGTNFVFRRAALDAIGGFPEHSLTEDFELSMNLHQAGWKSAYVPRVLAHGLGPEDMVSYVGQQGRWAQGCLSALPRILKSRLPLRLRAQYLLASSYFMSGWTVLLYMSLPVIRIFGHAQPIHQGSANQFLIHFVPYFGACVVTVAIASDGVYSFGAYSLAAANFGIHIRAGLRVVLRRRGKFVVTPKHGADGRQLRPIWPALVALAVLSGSVVYAASTSRAPSAITNMAFASIHIVVLLSGTWSALVRRRLPEAVTLDVAASARAMPAIASTGQSVPGRISAPAQVASG